MEAENDIHQVKILDDTIWEKIVFCCLQGSPVISRGTMKRWGHTYDDNTVASSTIGHQKEKHNPK